MRPWAVIAIGLFMTAAAGADPAPVGADSAPSSVPTTEPIARPAAAGRLVRLFDFEEKATNPGDVPRDWYRAQEEPGKADRPGFPPWNKASLVFAADGAAASGEGAVRLPTAGGSTSLVLGPGVLPVFHNADYLVTAKARTRGLSFATAGVATRFIDRAGHVIEGSETRSEFVRSAHGDDGWIDLRAEAVGRYPDAAFLQIELLLLQPGGAGVVGAGPAGTSGDASVDGKYRVVPQDFAGAAWFDDVAVMQLPRVELTTQSDVNIIESPQRPELRWIVRDLTGEQLSISLDILDARGRTVDRATKQLGGGTAGSAWTPALKELGWYRASMQVVGRNGPVGWAVVDFVWVPPRADLGPEGDGTVRVGAATDRVRLGLIVSDLYPELSPHLPAIVRGLGVGAITLPAWSTELTADSALARAAAMARTVSGLRGIDVTVALPRVPWALASATHHPASDVWEVLAEPPGVWLAYAGPFFESLGQTARHWQIGRSGDDAIYRSIGTNGPIAQAVEAVRSMVPAPNIAVPTRSWDQWPMPVLLVGAGVAGGEGGVGGVRLIARTSGDESAEGVGEQAARWAADVRSQRALVSSTPTGADVVIVPADAALVGARRASADAARRLVLAWAGASGSDSSLGFALEDPWVWSGVRRPALAPTPAFAGWRATSDRLVGRRAVGELALGEGVRAILFAPTAGTGPGMIAAWTDTPGIAPATVEASMGEGPFGLIDHLGNRRDLALQRDAIGAEVVRLMLTDEPVFIEGVNVPLVQLLASIRLDPPMLETNNRQAERRVLVTNAFPVGVNGRVTILEPGGFIAGEPDRTWRIGPRELRFSAAAGEQASLPVNIAFAPAQEAGVLDFVFRVELAADRTYGPILVRRPVAVGLRGLSVELSYSTRPNDQGGRDVVVEAAISNSGDRPVTLDLTAFAPDEPRRKSAVTDLPPGEQTVRRFVYAAGASRLAGKRVNISVADHETGSRFNRAIVID